MWLDWKYEIIDLMIRKCFAFCDNYDFNIVYLYWCSFLLTNNFSNSVATVMCAFHIIHANWISPFWPELHFLFMSRKYIVSFRGENIIVCFFFLTNFLTRKMLPRTHIKNKWKNTHCPQSCLLIGRQNIK